jgi:hypothetical protein
MKVVDLQKKCKSLGIDTKGKKVVLEARLQQFESTESLKIDTINEDLKPLEDYFRKYWPRVEGSHLNTLVDSVYMAAIRNNNNIKTLPEDLFKGILNLEKYRAINDIDSNIYDFFEPKYVGFAQRIKDLTVWSNGGMANIGKGEWLISISSGIDPLKKTPRVNIIKNGNGDLFFEEDKKTEEIKWNGGKVSVKIPGNEVNRKFNKLITINDKEWVPFRVGDIKKYSEEEIRTFNAVYWNAISDDNISSLSDNELRYNIINMSFKKVFESSNSFVMFNNDGRFHRFNNIEEVNIYYQDNIEQIDKKLFECRAKQSNPPALYCHVF